MPSPQSRRTFLTACGFAGLSSVSGCIGGRRLENLVGSDPDIDCQPSSHEWPMYGFDWQRRGVAGSRELPPADATAQQLTQADNGIEASPAVSDGVAYAAGTVRVEARNIESGERLWAYDPGDNVSTMPALGCGVVFVALTNDVVALDPDDGTELWRTEGVSGFDQSGSPLVYDGTVYTAGPELYALDAETGEEHWNAAGGEGVAVGDYVYTAEVDGTDGAVLAYTDAGDEQWRAGVGPVYTTPVVADGLVYAVTKDGSFYALDATDGSVRWRTPIPSGIFDPPAVSDGTVVLPPGNGDFARALDAETGESVWRYKTGNATGAPTVFGDIALLPGANTGVHAVELETGELVRAWDAPAVGSAPILVDGTILYRAWNDSEVYVLR
ncbi:outer membrane protein assembly factor BamB family protein [Haloprofundus marisrubri]|nr:PQQ-binding-like beta-propeller repeat protein [Haloprofundus marisrubri]